MIKAEDTTDDLIALARRGDLPESEDHHLREQLAVDDEARELYKAGLAFDAEAPMQPGDGARLERIVNAVDKRVRSGGKARPLRRRRIALMGLAAAMLMTTGVGAVVLARRSASRPALSPTSPAPDQPAPASAPPRTTPARESTTTTTEPVSVPSKPIAPVRLKTEPRPAPPSTTNAPAIVEAAPAVIDTAPEVNDPTATELFASANRARVRQDLTEAIRLSRQLVDRYPQSPQAKTTRLSLALMYLQMQQPALALDELRAAAPSAEVLWAESQALRDLGRTASERTTLEALVARYPGSAYTGAARARLEAIH